MRQNWAGQIDWQKFFSWKHYFLMGGGRGEGKRNHEMAEIGTQKWKGKKILPHWDLNHSPPGTESLCANNELCLMKLAY